MSDPLDSSPPSTSRPAPRRVILYSLLAGFCPLIPIPFLDDWVRDAFRRRLASDLVRQRGLRLARGQLKTLACGISPPLLQKSLQGCLTTFFVRPVVKLIVKLVAKIFRKIIFVLMIKDCLDTFSHTFHEGYLIHHAVHRGDLDAQPPPVEPVRRAIERTSAEIDPRPLESLLKKSLASGWNLALRGWRELLRYFRLVRKGSSEQTLLDSALVDQVEDLLNRDLSYIRRLETIYTAHLDTEMTPARPVET